MQSKVLCLLFVTLVATSVTAGIIDSVGGAINSVRNASANARNASKNALSNSSNSLQDVEVPRISIPSTPNIIALPNVASGVAEAERLLGSLLGSVGNLADTLTNLVTAALKGAQPLVDLINILTQVLKAFSKVAAGNPLDAGLLILRSGLQLAQVIVGVVIPLVVNVASII